MSNLLVEKLEKTDLSFILDHQDLFLQAVSNYYSKIKEWRLIDIELDLTDNKIFIEYSFKNRGQEITKKQQNKLTSFLALLVESGELELDL